MGNADVNGACVILSRGLDYAMEMVSVLANLEEKVQARKALLASAYYHIHCAKVSRFSWENDDEVLDLAYDAGIQEELPHISALAANGFLRG